MRPNGTDEMEGLGFLEENPNFFLFFFFFFFFFWMPDVR